jgi:hypothetical protein
MRGCGYGIIGDIDGAGIIGVIVHEIVKSSDEIQAEK